MTATYFFEKSPKITAPYDKRGWFLLERLGPPEVAHESGFIELCPGRCADIVPCSRNCGFKKEIIITLPVT